MRLQSLIPAIPADLVTALETCGIRSDSDLLSSGTPIDILQRLPSGIVSLADFKTYIALVTENASARGVYGDALYAEELQMQDDHNTDLSCGVNELDVLVGGFGNGRVFEISGDRGSGKTLLVLQIALRLLAENREASVLWMDTTGDFSAERIRLIAQHSYDDDSSTVLERLKVSLVLNIETAHVLLEDLEASLKTDAQRNFGVRLVIIDSITPLFAPSLSAISSHGHAVMTTFMQHLRRMARAYYLAIIVINSTSASPTPNPISVFPATRKPALGPSFTFLTDCTIWLAKLVEDVDSAEAGSLIHTANILKSRSTRSGTWCKFKIQNGVLRSTMQE